MESRKLDYIDYFIMKYDPEIEKQTKKVLEQAEKTYYDIDENKIRDMVAIAILSAESLAHQKKQKVQTTECHFYTHVSAAGERPAVECNLYVSVEVQPEYYKSTQTAYATENKIYYVVIDERAYGSGAVISVSVHEY